MAIVTIAQTEQLFVDATRQCQGDGPIMPIFCGSQIESPANRSR